MEANEVEGAVAVVSSQEADSSSLTGHLISDFYLHVAPSLNLNTHDAALVNAFMDHYYQRISGFQGLVNSANGAAPTITMCGDSSYHAQNVQINIDPDLKLQETPTGLKVAILIPSTLRKVLVT